MLICNAGTDHPLISCQIQIYDGRRAEGWAFQPTAEVEAMEDTPLSYPRHVNFDFSLCIDGQTSFPQGEEFDIIRDQFPSCF